MAQRQAQKEATKAKLLKVAIELFEERGFAAVKTLDVAKSAGVSHGSVFVHFSSRETLITEAVAAFGRQVTVRLKELASGSMSVRDVLTAHLKGIGEYEGFYSRLAAEAPGLPVEAREMLLCIQSAISHHLLLALKSEEALGSIKTMPHYFVFNVWIGVINHYLINHDLFAPHASVVHEWGDRLVDNFITLLGKYEEEKK